MARELKRVGFRFVGPTTAYSLMQAVGLVNDHFDGLRVSLGDGPPHRLSLRWTSAWRTSMLCSMPPV